MYLICREVSLLTGAMKVTICRTEHACGYIQMASCFRENNTMEEDRRNYLFRKKEFLLCQPFDGVCCSGQSVYVSGSIILYNKV